jgi:hypothetical protein
MWSDVEAERARRAESSKPAMVADLTRDEHDPCRRSSGW